MNPWLSCAALTAVLAPPCLRGAELSPQDFAFGVPVATAKAAAAYRIAVPFAVYQNTFRDDLADIRIFNAQGQTVPYASRRSVLQQSDAAPIRLPLFPLQSGSRAEIDGVRVTILGSASSVNWQTQPAKTVQAASIQYVLDGRQVTAALSALELGWSETDLDFSGRIRVEASDDLNEWRTVVAAAPVVNLRAGGQSIIQNRVALPGAQGKFWRLSWLGTAPTFPVTSVSARPVGNPAEAVRAVLDVAGSSDAAKPQEMLFDLGAHAPVDRVNLLLPEPNTVVTVELSSRPGSLAAWRPVAHAGFFRFAAADGDNQNAAIPIPLDRDRYWKATVLSGSSFGKSLRLRAQWIPDDVTFLARGSGPFVLAYGSAAAGNGEVDLKVMPPNIEIVAATTGDSKVLGGPARLKPQAAPVPTAQIALWGILLLTVLALAWMAYRLVQEQKRAQ